MPRRSACPFVSKRRPRKRVGRLRVQFASRISKAPRFALGAFARRGYSLARDSLRFIYSGAVSAVREMDAVDPNLLPILIGCALCASV